MTSARKVESDYFTNLFDQGANEAFNMFPPNSEQNPVVITELFYPSSRITIKADTIIERLPANIFQSRGKL